MKFSCTVVTILALTTSVTTVVTASSSSQQEVQYRLRGGVPASFNAKTTVEERRLQDEEIDDSFLSLDEVTDGPPNSPTAASTSASDSEDTPATAASASSADCASISKFQVLLLRRSDSIVYTLVPVHTNHSFMGCAILFSSLPFFLLLPFPSSLFLPFIPHLSVFVLSFHKHDTEWHNHNHQ